MLGYYVYIAFRPNGIPCYVGKGKGNCWRHHFNKCRNPHLARIIKNSGGALYVEKFLDGLTEPQALELEVILIAAIGRRANGGPLANMTDGGEGVSGYKFPRELVERLRKMNLGRIPWNKGLSTPAEIRSKQSAAKKGRPLSAKSLRAIRIGAKRRRGIKMNAAFCAAVSAGKRGKRATDKAKEALRAANRSRDPEVRALISRRTKEAMQRPEIKAAMLAANRRPRSPRRGGYLLEAA